MHTHADISLSKSNVFKKRNKASGVHQVRNSTFSGMYMYLWHKILTLPNPQGHDNKTMKDILCISKF